MGLTVVTAPTAEPVDVDELKLQLKIDLSADDALISDLGKAAREYVEAYTRRTLLETTYDLKLDAFPCGDIVLPHPPVRSVTSVTYIDQNGDSQVMTAGATGYLTDLPAGPHAEPGRIYPGYQVLWPVTRCQPNAVTVRYVAGYGTTSAAVPRLIKAAIKHLVEHWYTNRGVIDGGINSVTSQVPIGVEAQLGGFKLGWA